MQRTRRRAKRYFNGRFIGNRRAFSRMKSSVIVDILCPIVLKKSMLQASIYLPLRCGKEELEMVIV
jgi:hypothetical protein